MDSNGLILGLIILTVLYLMCSSYISQQNRRYRMNENVHSCCSHGNSRESHPMGNSLRGVSYSSQMDPNHIQPRYFHPEEYLTNDIISDDNSDKVDNNNGQPGNAVNMDGVSNSNINDNTDESMDNYNDFVALNSLESTVYKSHDNFVKDVQNRVTGASAMSIRADDNDVNPWVGLRRPNYYDVTPDINARVVPSEFPHQMSKHTRGQGCLIPY